MFTWATRLSVPSPQWQSIYINYLKFFCTENYLFFPIIYLFSHLFTSSWTRGSFFYTSVIIQHYVIYFIAQIVLSVGHWELFPLAPVSLWRISIPVRMCVWGFVLFHLYVKHFLLSGTTDAPGSCWIFPASAASPRSPDSFYWRLALETKAWAFSAFVGARLLLMLNPLKLTELRNAYVYTNPYLHIYTSMHF